MSQPEFAFETAFRKQRQLEETETADFLNWVHEIVEAGEKTELTERIQELELENESLQESPAEDTEPISKEECERDLMLSDKAEVLSDMIAEEELDDAVESDLSQDEVEEESEAE